MVRGKGLCRVLAINLNQLRRALNDGQHAQAISGDIANSLGNRSNPSHRREFIRQQQALKLEVWIAFGQFARVQVDQLLKKQVQQRRHALKVIRRDAKIDAHAKPSNIAQIEIVGARGGVDKRV